MLLINEVSTIIGRGMRVHRETGATIFDETLPWRRKSSFALEFVEYAGLVDRTAARRLV